MIVSSLVECKECGYVSSQVQTDTRNFGAGSCVRCGSSEFKAWEEAPQDKASFSEKVDEIFTFGYEDPTFVHDVHVLIGGEQKVLDAKQAITALFESELEQLKTDMRMHTVPEGQNLITRSYLENSIDFVIKRLHEGGGDE